ncbi:MAG: hypothetical protein RL106_1866 [Bacteroidota bacterium]|jgi:hypothetical protein
MKNAKKWGRLMLLAGSGLVYSCRPDADTTAPEINSITVDGMEADTHTILAGDVMQVVLDLHDNENLKQVKVNVHAADDGHTHGSGSGAVGQPNIGSWSYSRIIEVEGQHATADLNLTVPFDIAGEWHLEVMAIDASGNEAVEKVVNLQVINAELPIISVVTTPASTDSPMLLPINNPTITFNAYVMDASGIDSLFFQATTEAGELVFSQALDGEDVTEFYSGNVDITFPAVGLYDVEVRALDVNGYENIWMREVQVQ